MCRLSRASRWERLWVLQSSHTVCTRTNVFVCLFLRILAEYLLSTGNFICFLRRTRSSWVPDLYYRDITVWTLLFILGVLVYIAGEKPPLRTSQPCNAKGNLQWNVNEGNLSSAVTCKCMTFHCKLDQRFICLFIRAWRTLLLFHASNSIFTTLSLPHVQGDIYGSPSLRDANPLAFFSVHPFLSPLGNIGQRHWLLLFHGTEGFQIWLCLTSSLLDPAVFCTSLFK